MDDLDCSHEHIGAGWQSFGKGFALARRRRWWGWKAGRGMLGLRSADGDSCKGAKLRSSVLGSKAVKIANDVDRNAELPSLVRGRSLTLLGSNQGQFAGIEPVTSATRALVHFDPAFGAEEVPAEFHARAAGTFKFMGFVHD